MEWDQKEIAVEVRRGSREDVPAKFGFRNAGDKPVILLGVTADCGCTEAYPEHSTIAPGGRSVIWALFTIGERTGSQAKTITVKTDEPGTPETVLTFKVNILAPAETTPAGGANASAQK